VAAESPLRIGWIGTGIMGASMCGHLMAAGHPATVFTRTRVRAEPLLGRGAAWGDTPRAVAAASDVTFTMVGYPSDVREVVLGHSNIYYFNSRRTLVDQVTVTGFSTKSILISS
jgi:3-hydroxyisobutyrate dehydrogenase